MAPGFMLRKVCTGLLGLMIVLLVLFDGPTAPIPEVE
jgi:hypothetical protein